MDIAVGLVKAYLELCGYFVVTELPVRVGDEYGFRDETDLDVVAVRFPQSPRSPQESAPVLPSSESASAPGPLVRPLDMFLGSDPTLHTFEEGVDVLVGEVKEGKAHLNAALHRAEVVAFALRRVGCCPERGVEPAARSIAQQGQGEMTMRGDLRCRVRLVAFGGHGAAAEPGVQTVPLSHCIQFIVGRLRDGGDALSGAQFKDPVLGLLALQAKFTKMPGLGLFRGEDVRARAAETV